MNEGKDADLTKQIQITNQITYKMADTLGKMYELSLDRFVRFSLCFLLQEIFLDGF